MEGEPAFLKYWLQQPATQRSTDALQAEEGLAQVGADWGGLVFYWWGGEGGGDARDWHCS